MCCSPTSVDLAVDSRFPRASSVDDLKLVENFRPRLLSASKTRLPVAEQPRCCFLAGVATQDAVRILSAQPQVTGAGPGIVRERRAVFGVPILLDRGRASKPLKGCGSIVGSATFQKRHSTVHKRPFCDEISEQGVTTPIGKPLTVKQCLVLVD